jgi:GABA(A) receptor-associated protein
MNNITTSYSYPQTLYTNSCAAATVAAAAAAAAAGGGGGVAAPRAVNDHLERLKKSQLILEKYPDRVPLIVKPSDSDRNAFPIDKSKYITPRDLTLLQLQQIIRKRIHFPPEKALFMFINNKIYPITSFIGPIYDTNKDADGFLYITYCQESTFGGAPSHQVGSSINQV